MQKNLFVIIAFLMVTLTACKFSKGVKKDVATGLSASYNGLFIDDIYLADDKENRLGNNNVTLGSTIMVMATGVDGFEIKDGKVFPACEIIITDKNKKELLNLPDAFTDMANGTPASEAKILRAQVNTGAPMVVGDTYHLYVKFYDKNKKENEIIANLGVLVNN